MKKDERPKYRESGRLEPGFLHLSLVLNHHTKEAMSAIGTNSRPSFYSASVHGVSNRVTETELSTLNQCLTLITKHQCKP